MLSISCVISPMRTDAASICCMVWATPSTALLLRSLTDVAWLASCIAWLADSVVSLTVPVICSIDAAVSSRLAACASVRADRSRLSWAILTVATCILSLSSRASRTTDCRFTPSWARAFSRSPTTPLCLTFTRCVKSPAASRLACRTSCNRGTTATR